MSEKPISPLRRRMIEDMTVRNFVEKTHNDYIRHVRTIDLPGLPQIPAPVTDQSCAATSSANTLIGVGGPHPPPSCANLHSARRSRRHRLPFPAVSLYGLCQGGVSIGDRSAHLFSFVSFFVRSESPFLRPDLHLACRWRAQKLSRLAVAPTLSDKLRRH